jgi:hypothetical protein
MPNWHIKCARWTVCATLCIPEKGVAMFSSVLISPHAIQVNIAIMRTFVQLRRLMDGNRDLARRIGPWMLATTSIIKTSGQSVFCKADSRPVSVFRQMIW